MPTATTEVSYEEIPLTEVALRLHMPYAIARDLMFRGDVKGSKRDGRWYVEVTSIAAFEARAAVAKDTA